MIQLNNHNYVNGWNDHVWFTSLSAIWTNLKLTGRRFKKTLIAEKILIICYILNVMFSERCLSDGKIKK